MASITSLHTSQPPNFLIRTPSLDTTDPSEQFIKGAAVGPITMLEYETLRYGAAFLGLIPNDKCFLWKEFYQIMSKYRPLSEKDAFNAILSDFIFMGPIKEELIFRGLIQDLLLKRLLGKAIQAVSPRNASWVDSRVAKIFRIIITAALFGAAHLGTQGQAAFKFQAFYAFAGGCILGAIKESRLGLIGSIGCHMMNNALVGLEWYANCIYK